jgi:hypothetical protein
VVEGGQDPQHWTAAPKILAGGGASISWPATPLVLRWSQVPYAYKYIITIATDPALSNPVLGSVAQPVYTQSNSYAFPSTLANGTYYWPITPSTRKVTAAFACARARSVEAGRRRRARASATSAPPLACSTRCSPGTQSWAPPATRSRSTSRRTLQRVQNGAVARRRLARPSLPSRFSATAAPTGGGCVRSTPTGMPVMEQRRVVYEGLRRSHSNHPQSHDARSGGQALTGTPVSTDTRIVTRDPVPGASRYEVQLGLWSVASDFAIEVGPFFNLILGGCRGHGPGGCDDGERQAQDPPAVVAGGEVGDLLGVTSREISQADAARKGVTSYCTSWGC